MNPLLIFSVAPLAVLGAILVATGWFGWGVAFWVLAMALSQASFLADVWAEYRQQGSNEVSLYAAFVTCLRRSV